MSLSVTGKLPVVRFTPDSLSGTTGVCYGKEQEGWGWIEFLRPVPLPSINLSLSVTGWQPVVQCTPESSSGTTGVCYGKEQECWGWTEFQQPIPPLSVKL
ncbi:hypothetical protein, partial [Rhodohalobacter sulfatireducens]